MERELCATINEDFDYYSHRLLGNKRECRALRDNYIFRRVMTGKVSGKYEKLANIYYCMMDIDWEYEKIGKYKTNIMTNLNSTAFWFYICSNYFSYCSNEFLNKSSAITENMNRILEKIIINKRSLKNKSNIRAKLKYMNDLQSILLDENADKEENFYSVEHKNDELSSIYLSTDEIIDNLTEKLNKLREKNNSQFANLINTINHQSNNFLCTNEANFNYDSDEILIDMQYQNSYNSQFQQYLIKKNEEKASFSSSTGEKNSKQPKFILTRIEEEMNSNPDDIVCLVCNDGDYEDYDLIVYCSSCQMTVHQTCYGIVNLPKDDWICYPCLAFGNEKGKQIDCLLCPVLGGAMKPCNIKKSSQLYNNLISLRGGSKFNAETIIKLASLVSVAGLRSKFDEEQEFNEIPEFNLKSENNLLESKSSDSIDYCNSNSSILKDIVIKKKEQLILIDAETNKQTHMSSSSPLKKRGRKKKFKRNSNNHNSIKEEIVSSYNEFINKKIALENAWVHLSCALWLPEVEFGEFNKKEQIKNLENIDKTRFVELCTICKMEYYGPTIKCKNENCNLRFHVECARINKFLLEKVSSYSGDLKFYIFCQIHRPHQLIKNIDLSRQRNIDDIVNFSEVLNKNFDLLTKLDKKKDFSVFAPKRYGLQDPDKKNKNSPFFPLLNNNLNKSSFTNKDRSKIVKTIRQILIDISNLNLRFIKVPSESGEFNYEENKNKNKIKVTYEETLSPSIFPWYLLKGITKFSPMEIYNYYIKELVPCEEIFYKLIIKKSLLKKSKIKLKNRKLKFNQKIDDNNNSISYAQFDPNLYCYCKQTFKDGEFMINCVYGDESKEINPCVNNGWVHKNCVDELKNLDVTEIEDDNFVFACKECIEKYGKPNKEDKLISF